MRLERGTRGPAAANIGAVVVLALLMAGPAPALSGELGQAASRGDLATVNALIRSGAVDLNERDGLGAPLHRAIMGEYYVVARRLIAAGADLDAADPVLGTPLYFAIRHNNDAGARLLIAAGADPAGTGPVGTALHIAAQHDLDDIVTLLLERGADPNARNAEAETPLMRALGKGSLHAARVLIAAGADIEAKDWRGRTPIFHAAAGPNAVNAVALLLSKGAKVDLRDKGGVTPLDLATRYDRFRAAEMIRVRVGGG